jgi:hypothetical protein
MAMAQQEWNLYSSRTTSPIESYSAAAVLDAALASDSKESQADDHSGDSFVSRWDDAWIDLGGEA